MWKGVGRRIYEWGPRGPSYKKHWQLRGSAALVAHQPGATAPSKPNPNSPKDAKHGRRICSFQSDGAGASPRSISLPLDFYNLRGNYRQPLTGSITYISGHARPNAQTTYPRFHFLGLYFRRQAVLMCCWLNDNAEIGRSYRPPLGYRTSVNRLPTSNPRVESSSCPPAVEVF